MADETTTTEPNGGRGLPADDPAHLFAEEIEEETLVVDLGAWEGPLDLLLTLARRQKVDLARISILDLVDQYLAFVERVRERRLEVAADHLVMAAWLTYLKSRLLLPKPPQDDEPSGEDLAAELGFRLRRLEAMREKAAELLARPRVGREIFLGGRSQPVGVGSRVLWEASLWDLLSAYAGFRERTMVGEVRVGGRAVWSLVDAREILERLIGPVSDWVPLDRLVADHVAPETRTALIASTFAASLEMVREGVLEISQAGAFAPLMLRPRERRPEDGEGDEGEGEETA